MKRADAVLSHRAGPNHRILLTKGHVMADSKTTDFAQAPQFQDKTLNRAFWSKVAIAGPDECWEWLASRVRNGYGRIRVNGVTHHAHRLLLAFVSGCDMAGKDACHSCDNKGCVNPAHLFVGTRSDNMQDCARKGRNAMQLRPHRSHFNHMPDYQRPRGNTNGTSKLTDDKAREIVCRAAAGESQRQLAAAFGVSYTAIYCVCKGITWSHATGLRTDTIKQALEEV